MSQFNTISPDFRDSLRELADEMAKKKEASKPTPALTIRVAMDAAEKDFEEILEEQAPEEGNQIGADNK